MRRTDRHFHHLVRLISRRAMLYTEMTVCGALLFGDWRRFQSETWQHPVGLQLGGSDPGEMARGASLSEELGYDEVNVNVGCPSSRVRSGAFGACLMLSPQKVADCVAAMSARVTIPVTVKCRLGVEQGRRPGGGRVEDGRTFAGLCSFVETVSAAGCGTFIIHARKAILGGLSPKQNRVVPGLRYDVVRALKREFPRLEIVLNGGLSTLSQAKREIENGGVALDGAMLGRSAYRDPMLLAEVDAMFYGEPPAKVSRYRVVEQYLDYLGREAARDVPTSLVSRHLVHCFHGQPGARRWRCRLGDSPPRLAGLFHWMEGLRSLARTL